MKQPLLLILCACFFSICCLSQTRLDSLKISLKDSQKRGNLTHVALFVVNIAAEMNAIGRHDSALVYYYKSLPLSHNDQRLEASILGGIATSYVYFSYRDSSVKYYTQALRIYEKLKDTVNTCTMESNLSFTYKSMGLYEKALETSFSAITKLERRKPDRALASCYNTVAGIYKLMEDYSNALQYYNKTLLIRQQINFRKGIAQSFNNIGETFIQMRKYDSALVNLNKSVAIKRKDNDANALGTSLNLIGEIYLRQQETPKALAYFLEALEIKEHFGDRSEVASILGNLGELYILKNDWASAEQYIDEAETLTRAIASQEQLRRVLELKVKVYRTLHLYPQEAQYLRELLVVKDSLLNKDKAESLIALQTRYETEKKEQHIQLLEQDKLVQQAEIKSKQSWIATLIITIVFVIVIALLLFMGYRISQRNRYKVEMLLKELHHRVKNNLQILSSILSLQSLHLTDANAIEAIKSSESRVNTMALIHKKLYKDESNRTIDIHEYVTELSSFLLHSYGYSAQTLKLTITGEGIHVDVDKAIPIGLILNELISNALKYAYPEQANPQLDIHFQLLTSAELKIELRDNGKGMAKSENNDNTGSFGLKMVNTLIKELKGKITIATQKGTAYTLQLPLHHG